MPLGVRFTDFRAERGRPRIAPKGETNVPANSTSRSLAKLDCSLHCEYKNSNLLIHTKNILSDKIKIRRKDAIAFALWILKITERETK